MNELKINEYDIGNVLKDIELFEKKLFNCDNNFEIGNYYNFLNDKELFKLTTNCYLFLKKSKNFTHVNIFKLLENSIVLKIKIDFNEFKVFKNFNDFFFFYFAIFIVKSFQISSFKKEETNENVNYLHMYDSDMLINFCINEFFNFILALDFLNNTAILINKDNIRDCFVKAFLICVINKLIFKKNTKFFQGKTYSMLYIDQNFSLFSYNIKIYTQKFEIFEKNNNIYLYSGHFSSITEVNKKISYSNFKFNQKKEFNEAINSNFFYIDKNRLNIVISDLLEFYEKKIEFLEKEYNTLQHCLKNFIKEGNMGAVSEISKQISIILNLFKLKKISELNLENKKIYAPFIICFRGRFYTLSDVSFTFYKEFRYCTYMGFYDINKNNEKFHKWNYKTIDVIFKYKYLLEQSLFFKKHIENLKKEEIIAILFLMISISEYKKNNFNGQISLKTFIETGINICENIEKELQVITDIYEKIQIKYYFFIILEALNTSNMKERKMWLVSKDATASCYQHLIKILGGQNEQAYEYCNLKSMDTWYDTYYFIIEGFLKNKKFTDNSLKKYFIRSILKKTIMTEAYGISYINARKYFFSFNQKQVLNLTQYKELDKIFKEFYNYLGENLLFFKVSPKKIINIINKNSQINLNNGESTNIIYLKADIITITYKISGYRQTKQKFTLIDWKNEQKTKRASRANYVQLLESAVARHVKMYSSSPIVHDCFTIDYLNIPFILSIVNEGMNINFHNLNLNKELLSEERFSFFIIL